jgi:hypothetical protein
MHMAGAAQETADSSVPLPDLPGLGTGWIAHRRPFQRSASVPSSVDPTAVQAEREVQDTAARLAVLFVAAADTGTGAASGGGVVKGAAAACGATVMAEAATAMVPTASRSLFTA